MSGTNPSRSLVKPTRGYVEAELKRLVDDMNDRPVPEGAFGRFVVNVELTVREGRVFAVKSSSFFERTDLVGVTG